MHASKSACCPWPRANCRANCKGSGRRWRVARIVVALALSGFGWGMGRAQAQSNNYATYSGGAYTQNFSSLGTTAPTVSGSGPSFNLDTLFGVSDTASSNVNGWYGSESKLTTSSTFKIATGIPGGTTGYIYNFVNPAASSQVNAVGGLMTSSTGTVTVGVVLYNNTANTYGSANIAYTGQEWWANGTQAMNLSYQIASTLPSSITSGTFTPGPSGLNFTSPTTGSASATVSGSNAAPPAGDQASLSGAISGFSWAPGTYLVVDWTEQDSGGASGLGITNLSITPSVVAAANLTWNASGAGGTWDTTTANWLNGGSSATFTSNGTNAVTFGNTGVGPVTITGAGVNPYSTTVNNTSGTYTFSGGAITGIGSLTVSGVGGTLVLDSANSYSGGTYINAGTLNTGTAGDAGLRRGRRRRHFGRRHTAVREQLRRFALDSRHHADRHEHG